MNPNALPGAVAALAPLAGPAAPLVAMAAGLIRAGESILQLFSGCGQSCEHDTEVVEQFASSFHVMWYGLTGEALPGIPGVTPATIPGRYGADGINLFQASAYPNVPWPAGDAPGAPPIAAAIQALRQAYGDSLHSLVREQSVPNLGNNFDYFNSLLEQVAARQATAGSSVFDLATPAGGNTTLTPYLILAAVALAAVL